MKRRRSQSVAPCRWISWSSVGRLIVLMLRDRFVLFSVPARFRMSERNYTVRLDESVAMECVADGDLPMSIVWSYAVEALKDRSRSENVYWLNWVYLNLLQWVWLLRVQIDWLKLTLFSTQSFVMLSTYIIFQMLNIYVYIIYKGVQIYEELQFHLLKKHNVIKFKTMFIWNIPSLVACELLETSFVAEVPKVSHLTSVWNDLYHPKY